MIVSNTTPISNFLNLEQTTILEKFFNNIHIPYAVYQEIEIHFSENKEWLLCLEENFFVIHQLKKSFLINQFLINLLSRRSRSIMSLHGKKKQNYAYLMIKMPELMLQ